MASRKRVQAVPELKRSAIPEGERGAAEYVDLVIHARRRTARSVDVRVLASPTGRATGPVTVLFAEAEAQALRNSFRTGRGCGARGRMPITQAEATEFGKRLTAVLFPAPVFRALAQTLADVAQRPQGGLRIRLALDVSLIDLPWEYTYRPDRLDTEGVSGFLLLDPRISLVREAADPHIALKPITGRQKLAFIGALWEGGADHWEVRTEFDLLKAALKPVSAYVSPWFEAAADAFGPELRDAAILHYAGHCDIEADGRAYLVRQVPNAGSLARTQVVYVDDLAAMLDGRRTRLIVLSACNSGFWPAVEPLLGAGIPAVLGINGAVDSRSTIGFCAKLYESLAVGLTLDEAVGRVRLHVLEQGRRLGRFDWGLFMVYMPSPQAVLFPRTRTRAVAAQQEQVRQEHGATIESALRLARELDGLNFGEIMSELTKRRVLILGRFTGRRLEILKAIKRHLEEHQGRYIPELFTFRRPESRDLVESIIGFASLSRFIIADLSEPRSVQSELEAIVPHFQSVPIVPIINRTGREYATFDSIRRRPNVVKPTVRYRNRDDLLSRLDDEVVPTAEAKLNEVRPPA
jgi:CHAT domain